MNGTIRDKIGLAGRLIGIGKVDKDGSTVFNWLEKPVSNMMLQKGVDRLFKNNWGNSYTTSLNLNNRMAFFATSCRNYWSNNTSWSVDGSNWSYSSNGPAGAVSFVQYGTDNTPSVYETTTALGAAVSSKYDQLYRPNGNRYNNYPFQGTREISPGVLSMRISHIGPTSGANVSISEIGWWGASYQNGSTAGNFGLTSRIVLPTPYRLNSGERLITTYELILTLGQTTPVETGFTGLVDTDGNPLYAQVRRTLGHRTGNIGSTMTNTHVFDFPYIDDQGGGAMWPCNAAPSGTYPSTTIDQGMTAPPYQWYYMQSEYSNYKDAVVNNVAYSTVDKEIPSWGTAESDLTIITGTSRAVMYNETYVAGSHEIVTAINLPQFWPNLSADTDYADIHYLNIAGLAVRFGHTVDGVFVPQALRKLATQQWKIRFVTSIKTPNDT